MDKTISYIDLAKLDDNINDIILAKIDIENSIGIENQSLTKFLSTIKFDKVYIYDDINIAFDLINGNNSIYILYTINNPDEDKTKAFKEMKSRLEQISFDLSKLIEVDEMSLVNLENDDIHIKNFLIGNKLYK
jgi:hypothetical protein